MALKCYYDLMSQPSRALYIFLRKTGIKYEDKLVALRKGDHQTAEFSKLNPFMKVPVIDDGGFYLNESVAIIRYLAATREFANHWYPQDVKLRAKIDAFLNWQHLDIRLAGGTLFQASIGPLVTGEPLNAHRMEMGRKILKTSLDQMEGIFLADTPYIYNDYITVADVIGICEVMQPQAIGEPVFDGRPKLEVWADKVTKELNPDFDNAHAPVRKMGKVIQAGLAKLQSKPDSKI